MTQSKIQFLFAFLIVIVCFNFSKAQEEKKGEVQEVYLTMDVRDKDINEIIAFIQRETGANIVTDPDISVKVSVSLTDVPWLEALHIIAEQAKCEVTKNSDNIWLISKPPTVNMEFQGADIQKVIQVIATVGNMNIIYSERITGYVNIRIKDVPFREALDSIVSSAGYKMILQNRNILRIVHPDEISVKQELRIFDLKESHSNYFNLQSFFQKISKNSDVLYYDPPSNCLIALASPFVLSQLEEILVTEDDNSEETESAWEEDFEIPEKTLKDVSPTDPGKRISVVVKNKELHEVIASIREKVKAHIVIDPNISKKITITLTDVPWLVALQVIVANAKCELTKVSDIIWKISNPSNLHFEFKNTKLSEAIATIANEADLSIVCDPDVIGTVNVRLKNVTYREALESVVSVAGNVDTDYKVITQSPNILRVLHSKNIKKQKTTKSFHIKHRNLSEEFVKILELFLTEKNSAIAYDKKESNIFVFGTKIDFDRIATICDAIDKKK